MHWVLKLHDSIFYTQALYDLLIMAFLYAACLLKILRCGRIPNIEK